VTDRRRGRLGQGVSCGVVTGQALDAVLDLAAVDHRLHCRRRGGRRLGRHRHSAGGERQHGAGEDVPNRDHDNSPEKTVSIEEVLGIATQDLAAMSARQLVAAYFRPLQSKKMLL